MPRLRLPSILALVVAALWTAGPAAAETPPGPRLGYLQARSSGALEFLTAAPGGADVEPLVQFASPVGRPIPPAAGDISWSPDGSSFAYAGSTGAKGSGSRPGEHRVFVEPAGGGPAVALPGSSGGGFPVFAPDGGAIAVLRERQVRVPVAGGHRGKPRSQSSIWLLRLDGNSPRQLTPWRSLFHDIPASFAPASNALAIVSTFERGRPGHRKAKSEAVSLSLDGGEDTPIVGNLLELAYSPDGTRIALTRGGKGKGLWVGAADGSDLRRISVGVVTSPSWDPSGSRIAFLRQGHGGNGPQTILGFGNTVNEVNPDGSCPLLITAPSIDSAHYAPSWQPGPGRGAGPISC